jgi:hypothetical protein
LYFWTGFLNFENEDNKYKIFVNSDYPNLKINKLDGAITDKKMFNTNKNKT